MKLITNPDPATRYTFYIVSVDGEETVWSPLTLAQARNMHSYTSKCQPSNVKTFGWEEIK